MQEVYSFYDLCAGIGGFRLGLENTGRFKCNFGCEIDKKSCSTYEKNFGDNPIGDVTEIDIQSLPRTDLICAGFPCQAFSMIGKRKGFDDARGNIFFHIAKTIKAIRPRALFLENVSGLLSHNKGETFKTIKRVITEDLGYELFYKKLLASDYGIPQKRPRIYMVAFRDASPQFEWPSPVPLQQSVRSILEDGPLDSHLFLSKKYLTCLENHAIEQKAKGRGFCYQILDKDGISNTLVTGGSGRERNLVVDDNVSPEYPEDRNSKHVRALSPREFARLMGFPDTFDIPVSKTNAYKQFGNSVVVPVIEAIGRKIAETLDGGSA